jgi:hypothetical protein
VRSWEWPFLVVKIRQSIRTPYYILNIHILNVPVYMLRSISLHQQSVP